MEQGRRWKPWRANVRAFRAPARSRPALAGIVFLAIAFPLATDTLFLKDGTRLDGEIRDVGASYEVRTRHGVLTVPKAEVEKVEKAAAPAASPARPAVKMTREEAFKTAWQVLLHNKDKLVNQPVAIQKQGLQAGQAILKDVTEEALVLEVKVGGGTVETREKADTVPTPVLLQLLSRAVPTPPPPEIHVAAAVLYSGQRDFDQAFREVARASKAGASVREVLQDLLQAELVGIYALKTPDERLRALDKMIASRAAFLPDDLRTTLSARRTALEYQQRIAKGPFAGRCGDRNDLLSRGGGGTQTEEAVLAGLRWLARHQGADGYWDSDEFMKGCGKILPGSCTGAGYHAFDTGLSGLALLAFLGAGYAPQSADTHDGICFGKVVEKGLQGFLDNQDADGCLDDKGNVKVLYGHAIAVTALCEAYGMTGEAAYKGPAQKAVAYLLAAQNKNAGWRYGSQPGDNDSSVTGWCVMALKSAQMAGLSVPSAGYDGAMAWFSQVTDETYRVGYNVRGTGQVVVTGKNEHFANHEALTAIAMIVRSHIVRDPDDAMLQGGMKLLANDLPSWTAGRKPKIDFYYWYHGTMALYLADGPGGPRWRGWNDRLKEALLGNQKKAPEGCRHGSWDAIDRWGFEGGRIYATALNVLSLEVYYRYTNLFKRERRGTVPKAD